MEIIELIRAEAAAFGWIEWSATLLGVVYVWLAARNQAACWVAGVFSCALWAYASFVYYRLYLDALLQVFYVGIGFWGLYQWLYGTADKQAIPIRDIAFRQHAWFIGIGLLLSLGVGYAFAEYSAAAAPYWDAVTTVFSIMTTFLLVQRVLGNWLYWIVIDIVYVFLYASRGAYLFSALMVLYLLIAALAYRHWRQEWQAAAPAGNFPVT